MNMTLHCKFKKIKELGSASESKCIRKEKSKDKPKPHLNKLMLSFESSVFTKDQAGGFNMLSKSDLSLSTGYLIITCISTSNHLHTIMQTAPCERYLSWSKDKKSYSFSDVE